MTKFCSDHLLVILFFGYLVLHFVSVCSLYLPRAGGLLVMRQILPRLERPALWGAMVAAVSVIGYQAGTLTAWAIFPPGIPETGPPRVAPPQAGAPGQPAPETETTSVARALVTAVPPVFGLAPAPAPQEPVATQPPAMAGLLRLQGVSVTSTRKWALLATPIGVTVLSEGDRLPGGARLAEIRSDAVVLEQGGRRSTLAFAADAAGGMRPAPGEADPDTEKGTVALDAALLPDLVPDPGIDPPRVTTPTAPGGPIAAPAPTEQARPPVGLQKLRRLIFAREALASVRFDRTRLRDGAVGLRLKWVSDNALVALAGLQRGDVIRAVNGVAVLDGAGLQDVVAQLGQAAVLVVDYERKAVPMRATIPITKD